MRTLILALLLALLPLTAQEYPSRTRVMMGTYATVWLPKSDSAKARYAFDAIAKAEKALSSFDEKALLYRLNATHKIAYDPLLANALLESIRYHRETKGAFDITIGSVTKKLYRFGEKPRRVDEGMRRMAAVRIEGIKITPSTIQTDSDITLDLGGMGKGYGIDLAAARLAEQNVTRGRIALSGDIRCLDLCKVGIESPYASGLFAQIETRMPQIAISTSGTYRRYATRPEEHHLIDPKTKRPERHFHSVTLISLGDNSRLDAYATAVAVMPPAEALAFLKVHPEISFILVQSDGKILYDIDRAMLHLRWFPYKATAIAHTTAAQTADRATTAKGLIHPIVSQPLHIQR